MLWVMTLKKNGKERKVWLVFELGRRRCSVIKKKTTKNWWVPRSSVEFESLQHLLDWGEPEIQFQAMIPEMIFN